MFAPSLIGNNNAYFANLMEASAWFDGVADYQELSFGSNEESARFLLSFWLRRTELGVVGTIAGTNEAGNQEIIRFDADDKLRVQLNNQAHISSGTFTDTGWHHFVVSVEQGGSPDVSVYYDGAAIAWGTDASLSGNPSWFNSTNNLRIGRDGGSNYGAFYMAQYLALPQVSIQNGDFAISDFGTGGLDDLSGLAWTPKSDAAMAALADAAGGNAFCLTGGIGDGTDASANGNDFTATSMSHAANGSDDTPPKAFAVMDLNNKAASITLTNGLRKVACSSTGNAVSDITIAGTGAYMFETLYTAGGTGGAGCVIGACLASQSPSVRVGNTAGDYVALSMSGSLYDSTTIADTFSAPASGSVITVTYDTSTGAFEWFDDGVSLGTYTKGAWAGQDILFLVGDRATTGDALDATVNFGDTPFSHPQSGFNTLQGV